MTTTVLIDGLRVGESPRWHDGALWLAHWGTGEVLRIDPVSGTRTVAAQLQSVIPFCLDPRPDGRLLVVDGPERIVRRMEPDGTLVDHASLAELSPHAWNEIVADGFGGAYVNGGGFDMMAGEEPAFGHVAYVAPDGSARIVAPGSVLFGNGMALTADGGTLIVADSYQRHLTAFTVAADGGLSDQRVWADLGGGVPDGIALDAEGAVWVADVPNRCCTRVREGGEILERIDVDRACFSCCLGGDDGRTLFIAAAEWHGAAKMFSGPPTGQVLTARVSVPAAARP